MAVTRNFADVIRKQLAADPELARGVAEEHLNAEVAQLVYDARMAAGLTQAQLAERCRTQQSVISRIEDADYYGHSLSLLKRIAEALDCTLRVEFNALPKPPSRKRKKNLANKPVKIRARA